MHHGNVVHFSLGDNMTVKNGMKNRQATTHDFTIDYLSDVDNMRYQGTFTCKKLSIRDLAALGVRKSQLNGGMYYDPEKPGFGVDDSTDDLNAMIAQLELSITRSPTWWNLDDITDLKLLSEVYQEVVSFENSFLRSNREAVRQQQESVGNSQGNSGSNAQRTNPGGVLEQMVEPEVFPALEP